MLKDIELQEVSESLLKDNSDIDDVQKPLPQLPPTINRYEVEYKGTTIKLLPLNWRDSNLLKLQILLSFYMFVIVGISDQTIGSLMPSLIKNYESSQPIISIIFILSFSGYATSAFLNNTIHLKCGRLGVMVIAISLMFLTFTIESFRPNLIIFIGVYFMSGFGVGLMDSGLNVYLSSLDDHNELMGFLHGFYGVGSVIGPPLVSIILDKNDGGFGLHYFILAILCFVGLIGCLLLFKDETSLKYEYSILQNDDDDQTTGSGGDLNDFNIDTSFRNLIGNKLVLLGSIYLFLYIGAEVSIGTWTLSYLIHIKKMDQLTASFNVSWFWIGLTTGRMILGFITKFFKNEYRANLWYCIISLIVFLIYTIFTLIFSPSNLTDLWFSILNKSIIFMSGIFIGPLFPTANVSIMKILPKYLHVGAIGVVTSLGGSGSAIIPYFIGTLIHWTDFKYFPIYTSVVIAGYVITWALLPKFVKNMNYDF